MVAVFGGKLVSIFGFTSNVGNIFYAVVFLGVQLTLEYYGRKDAIRSVWVSFFAVSFFVLMGQVVLGFQTEAVSGELSGALGVIFEFVPRIMIASLTAFALSQYVNIYVYNFVRRKTGERRLWLRSLTAVFGGQLVDSLLFFSIAFWGLMPISTIAEIMMVGFVIKVAIGVMALPFLHMSRLYAPVIEAVKAEK
ncbi:MAG: queuosine precursor transporter [Patescibacteria group bacterium]|mgnify:CR=1 FL=1